MPEEKIYLIYKEDNGRIVSGPVDLISISDSVIVFKTHLNEITIPISRVLKIKKRLENM